MPTTARLVPLPAAKQNYRRRVGERLPLREPLFCGEPASYIGMNGFTEALASDEFVLVLAAHFAFGIDFALECEEGFVSCCTELGLELSLVLVMY